MSILRAVDGTFYEVPDSELEQYKVPPDQVKGLMEGAGQKLPSGPQQQQQAGQPAGEAGREPADTGPVHRAGKPGITAARGGAKAPRSAR